MHKASKLHDLLQSWAEQQLYEAKPELAYASQDELSEFNALVRDAMASELRNVRKPVVVRRMDRQLGELYTVTVRAGMQELYKLRWHKAFRRTMACSTCCARIKPAPISCRHWTPMQQFINRAYDSLVMRPDTRKLMYVLLVLREAVEHWRFYGFNPVEAKVVDPREREPLRPKFTVTREIWKDDDTRSSVEYVEVQPNDSTSRLYADLQGWDRPSSFSKKTQRLAFCGECAAKGHTPWFWVARKRVDGGYERAPFALTHYCPTCKSLEVEPDLAPRTNIQFVPRPYRRHGVVGRVLHLFYRSRERWVNGETNTVCSTQLNQRLQDRWLNLGRRKR